MNLIKQLRHFRGVLCILFCSILMCGCKVHRTLDIRQPTVCIPCEYQYLDQEGSLELGEWWELFGNEELNEVVTAALRNNLDLRRTWWKLAQACAQARIQGAARFPEITTTPGMLHIRTSSSGLASTSLIGLGSATTGGGGDPFTQYLLSNALSYEIDLWRRIDSKVKAACLEKEATREDLEATTLTLIGTVVDLWFTIQEQSTLLKVIDHQIEVSRTQLELIELRFATGQSSALDVYQQRLQLAQTVAERPTVQSLLETSQNLMQVLLGGAPTKKDLTVENGLVALPPFPAIGTPVDLLANRPDLRAQHRRLMAADYEVAAAIANRFPRFDLSIAYDFQAIKVREIFDEKISRIIAGLVTPIIDGGRREAEVQNRKAIVCELLQGYGQKFLEALLDVEDALTQEKHQLVLLQELENEIMITEANLDESRWQYINGLNDYLSVIAAIQSSQNLERRMVTERKKLLVIRTKLYRSLGGHYFNHFGMM